ncbi:hypothetical protein [Caballeronia sp. BR00000012568055]|nr:hypothetical protein [Caballeronia sp. BR00000012568055]
MVNITITERVRKLSWFVALWMAGVGGAMLLALPFKLLIKLGASIH